MDTHETQKNIGKMALFGLVILVLISIVVSYACYYMKASNEMFENQKENLAQNFKTYI